jgi:hypothetical protein
MKEIKYTARLTVERENQERKKEKENTRQSDISQPRLHLPIQYSHGVSWTVPVSHVGVDEIFNNRPYRSWAHPASFTMVTASLFPG